MADASFKPSMEQFPSITMKSSPWPSSIPTISLSDPDAKHLILKASEELGFFKVINHGFPVDLITNLESEAFSFFSKPMAEKERAGCPNPLGYGTKSIGCSGDIGWVEYLLMSANLTNVDHSGQNPQSFRCALREFVSAAKRLACELLEMMAEELHIQQKDVFSRLLKDEESDSMFRLNHYPPCPEHLQSSSQDTSLVGFGEHTDPQIISVLRANQVSGYEILLKDGTWVSVLPDDSSFFINIGDSLQVMTNGRFRSVRHRVVANSRKPRLSMLYFGGPPMKEKIGPLSCLMEDDKPSLYKELTWVEYKTTAFKKPLVYDRIVLFEKIAAS